MPHRALQAVPLLGSPLACLPQVQTTGRKRDGFSMLGWSSLGLAYSLSGVNILISLESFCKGDYFVSHSHRWSPEQHGLGKISAKMSRSHLRWACLFLSLRPWPGPTGSESAHPLSWGGCVSVSSSEQSAAPHDPRGVL